MAGKLTYSQLEGAWIQAGGPQAMAPVMAAIALAESGGDPAALNPNDNGGTQSSFGLWQISTGTHTPPSPNWADPLTNAKLAVGKYRSQGLGAWGTYTSGAYKRFMSNGVNPSQIPAGSVLNGTGTAAAQTAFGPTLSAQLDPTCLIGIPSLSSGFNLGPLSLGGPGTPSICFLSKKMARQLVGGSLIAAGLLGMAIGLAVIYRGEGVRTAAGNAWGAVNRGASPPVPVPVPSPPSAPAAGPQVQESNERDEEYRRRTALAAMRERGNALAPRIDASKGATLREIPGALAELA
jgi:hypothetical protein